MFEVMTILVPRVFERFVQLLNLMLLEVLS